jgi:DNA replication protein DnaC
MSYDINELPYMERHWLLKGANIPSRFIGMEPEDILARTGDWSADIEDWIDSVLEGKVIKRIGGINETGVGLLFDGKPGLGKTTHAVTTLMELVRRLPEDEAQVRSIFGYTGDTLGSQARPVYYLQYVDFLARKKALFDADPETRKELQREMDGFHGRAKEDWLNVRVLVIDDLGKEYKGAGYNDASFDEILRSRYDKGLPTIITTNVPREQWEKQYGEAMGSFAFEAFNRIEITGKDLRKNK